MNIQFAQCAEDELDMWTSSDPDVESCLRCLSKAGEKEFIKVVDRVWKWDYRKERPSSQERGEAFNYLMRVHKSSRRAFHIFAADWKPDPPNFSFVSAVYLWVAIGYAVQSRILMQRAMSPDTANRKSTEAFSIFSDEDREWVQKIRQNGVELKCRGVRERLERFRGRTVRDLVRVIRVTRRDPKHKWEEALIGDFVRLGIPEYGSRMAIQKVMDENRKPEDF